MKAFQRLVAAIGIVIAVAGLQISSVKAISNADGLTLTPAEEYVRQQLLANGRADLAGFSDDPKNRILSGTFILQLWRDDPDIHKLTSFEIDNAVIDGDIPASNITLPFDVEFQNCVFNDGVILDRARVKAFQIYSSTVNGSILMGRMVADGDVALNQSVFNGEVTLFGADLKSNLFARGSHFNAVKPDPSSAYPFELWTTHVGQTTEFTNAIFKGEVKADNAKFEGDLDFQDTTFEKTASFANIQVGNLASFMDATFKDEVTFESSVLQRDAQFTGAKFNGNANFDYSMITRFFDFDKTMLNKDFSMQYSTVGWPYFASTTFNGRANFEGMQTSNDLDFTDAAYNYSEVPFSISLVKSTGNGIFANFTAPAGLHLDRNQFENLTITGKSAKKFKIINLDFTKVDGDFDFENINADMISANGLSVAKSSTLESVNVSQSLDLSYSTLGYLRLDQFTFPSNSQNFNLHSATYTDINLNGDNRAQNTWNSFLAIIDHSTYDAQVYKSFAQFLVDKGSPDLAGEVELARKRRERNVYLTRYSWPWIWSGFLDVFAGYGQRPYYALFWSLLIICIGALIFRKEDGLIILDTSETKPAYNPFLYSFALFLPFIDLGIANKWEPKPQRKAAWMYKHVHRLLGWILMPIAILTFSGFIK